MSTDKPVVTRRITVNREVAVNMAKAADLQDILDALCTSACATLDAVDILTQQYADGSTEILVEAPSGCMVAWMVDDATASLLGIPGGEVDLHLTLAYLGDASALSPDQTRLLTGVVAEWASAWPAPSGTTSGLGRFNNAAQDGADVLYASVSIPGLWNMRVDLVQRLLAAGLPVDTTKDFTPHITLAYIPEETATPPVMLNPVYLDVDDITVCVGGARYTVTFPDDPDSYIDPLLPLVEGTNGQAYTVSLGKAAAGLAEERFTLAPWYIPNREDAHGEYTDTVELQKALWGYVESGDRDIRLQHDTSIVAGHWVEAMVWPHAVTVPVTVFDPANMSKSTTSHTYPAGTAFLGVKWEPWAWELVKSGDLQGLSIGGTADRLLVDLEKSGYADPGYQTDKKPRYPTSTSEQVRNGLSNIAQSAEAGKYTKSELAAVKRNLDAAATRLKMTKDDGREVGGEVRGPGPFVVHIHNELPPQAAAPDVHVAIDAATRFDKGAVTTTVQAPAGSRRRSVETDADGRITGIVEEDA